MRMGYCQTLNVRTYIVFPCDCDYVPMERMRKDTGDVNAATL